ncbi:MAG: hypothetical protein RL584_1628 [Pseudomonadota bacterium]
MRGPRPPRHARLMPDMTPMGHDHLSSIKTEIFELSDKSLNPRLKRVSVDTVPSGNSLISASP